MFDAFVSMITQAFKETASWFKLDGKEAFVVDFGPALSQVPQLSDIEAIAEAMGYSKDITVEAKNPSGKVEDLGYLEMNLGFKKN